MGRFLFFILFFVFVVVNLYRHFAQDYIVFTTRTGVLRQV
ncbi:hypothetical protein QTP86_027009 [Hemibagrus guttatus]|nr:hypothetical protein QTP86_027009 [Hemibagrus guttatus]